MEVGGTQYFFAIILIQKKNGSKVHKYTMGMLSKDRHKFYCDKKLPVLPIGNIFHRCRSLIVFCDINPTLWMQVLHLNWAEVLSSTKENPLTYHVNIFMILICRHVCKLHVNLSTSGLEISYSMSFYHYGELSLGSPQNISKLFAFLFLIKLISSTLTLHFDLFSFLKLKSLCLFFY